MTGSTTPALQLRKITGYPGIVVEEVILGANIFKDIFGAIGDIVGGRALAAAEWAEKHNADPKFIQRGKPMQNGFVERFSLEGVFAPSSPRSL